MSTIARFAVLLASAFAVLSSTAGAVTWHSTGPTGPSGISDSFHAAASTPLAWNITQSTGTGLGGTQCGGTPTATGTAPVGTFSGGYAITGTFRATPCNVLGQALYFECGYQFTAGTQSATMPAVTLGLTDLTCKLTADVAPFTGTYCTWAGTAIGHYTNPTYPTTPGRLTLTASSALRVTNTATTVSCSPWLINDPSAPGDLSELSFNLTPPVPNAPPGGPFLTRTA